MPRRDRARSTDWIPGMPHSKPQISVEVHSHLLATTGKRESGRRGEEARQFMRLRNFEGVRRGGGDARDKLRVVFHENPFRGPGNDRLPVERPVRLLQESRRTFSDYCREQCPKPELAKRKKKLDSLNSTV